MGRKKKKIKQTKIIKLDTISYQGSINVSLVNGDRTITTTKYHNKGMPNLFRFLANCLAGNKAESLRPVKIKLFNYRKAAKEGNSGVLPNNFNWKTAWEDPDDYPKAVSPYILYDTSPVISGNNETDTWAVCLHFRVPLSYIAGDTVNLIGLYPNNATDDGEEESAYYLMADLEQNIWQPIVIENVSPNYSLIMEWELSISNKTITTATSANEEPEE